MKTHENNVNINASNSAAENSRSGNIIQENAKEFGATLAALTVGIINNGKEPEICKPTDPAEELEQLKAQLPNELLRVLGNIKKDLLNYAAGNVPRSKALRDVTTRLETAGKIIGSMDCKDQVKVRETFGETVAEFKRLLETAEENNTKSVNKTQSFADPEVTQVNGTAQTVQEFEKFVDAAIGSLGSVAQGLGTAVLVIGTGLLAIGGAMLELGKVAFGRSV